MRFLRICDGLISETEEKEKKETNKIFFVVQASSSLRRFLSISR